MNIEKAQKRLVKAEKQIDKLHAGLEKQFGSDFGVDNAAYTEICQDVLEIKQALASLHEKASKLAATSTMSDVQARGPGNKRDD